MLRPVIDSDDFWSGGRWQLNLANPLNDRVRADAHPQCDGQARSSLAAHGKTDQSQRLVQMWFKAFVLLRLPIFALCLFAYANLLEGLGAFGGFMFLGLLAFLVFVSIRLVQFREGALGLAGVLLGWRCSDNGRGELSWLPRV